MSEVTFKECLRSIVKEANTNPLMSEEELYSLLVRFGFFHQLGYEKFGLDVKPQYVIPGERKKADYICRDEYQNVIFVLEAKKPSDEKLEDALDQLWERYVLPLKATFGVLTNGRRFVVYKRVRSSPELLFDLVLKDDRQIQYDELYRTLRKPAYDFTLHSRVRLYFTQIEKLSLKTDLAKENFFETFRLTKDAIFGELIVGLMKLFDFIYPKSRFLNGAYAFWRRSLAREPEKIPESWTPFLKVNGDVFKFMFCLESAHALLARLILGKACEDLNFPGISISSFVVQRIHHLREQIPIVGYPVVLLKLLKEMKDALVYSIFEEDIFSWWADGFSAFAEMSSGELLEEKVAKEQEDFSATIARLLFILYKYDFSEVAGDPLGDLYQQYFDRDTRKALGEFYTPLEVVNYILDSVEYKNVHNRRLLDPSCGSGTFLVEALHRYLKEMEPIASREGWAFVLKELCNSPRIVGFDIHPFACLIAQVRFMMELMPYYKKAIEEERFRVIGALQRLPIFRTDSLAIEMRPTEFSREPKLLVTPEDIRFLVFLPIKANGNETVTARVIIPAFNKAQANTQYNLLNLDEYFCSIQAVFDAVKTIARVEGDEIPTKGLEAHVKKYLSNRDFQIIAQAFKPYGDQILSEIRRLQKQFEDGRLIKSIEDSILAALLKNYLHYDFVVGNPPYVRQEIIKEYKEEFKKTYPVVFHGRADLYVYFIARGIDWLENGGKLSFICSNMFLKRGYGEKTRKLILDKCSVMELVDFGDSGVFQDASNYPCIITLKRKKEKTRDALSFYAEVRGIPGNLTTEDILQEIQKGKKQRKEIDSGYLLTCYVQHPQTGDEWRFIPEDRAKVMDKITKAGTHKLGDIVEKIFMGAQSNADSVHIVSQDVASKLQLEKPLLKTLVRGENVKRWKLLQTELFLVYPHLEIGNKVTSIPEKELKSNYPNTWSYFNLEENRKQLMARQYLIDLIEKGARQEWYELWIPKHPHWFENPKILTPDISNTNNFCYDEEGYYAPTTVFGLILKNNLKKRENYLYLLGLLNSKTLEFYFKQLSPFMRGKYYRYNMEFLEQLPIVWAATGRKKESVEKIVSLVELILRKSNIERFLNNFPREYLKNNLAVGEELDEIKFTFNADHESLAPSSSGRHGKEYVLYPDLNADPVFVETEEKARYLTLALKKRRVRKNGSIVVLLPRNNSTVKKILELFFAEVQEAEKISISESELKIDEIVHALYELNEEDKIIIEEFLKRY